MTTWEAGNGRRSTAAWQATTRVKWAVPVRPHWNIARSEHILYLRFVTGFIAALCILIAPGIATGTARAVRNRSITGPFPFNAQAKYLVVFVLDGARPDYFGLTPLPHVDALRAQGMQYTYALDGILESETPAGHATIATGSTPRRSGLLGFGWAQNENNYSLFSPTVVDSGAIDRIMQQVHVPTIAGLYKARHPYAKVVALSGHKYYAAAPLGGPQADAIMYYHGDYSGRYVPVAIPNHMPPPQVLSAPGLIANTTHLAFGQDDAYATKLALSALTIMHPRITLINYPEFDWPLGHVYGANTDRSAVIGLMKQFDQDLGQIEDVFRKRHVLRKTLFVITADHGMAPVSRFVPNTVIKNAIRKAGTTAPTITSTTASYIWLRDRAKARAVAHNILLAHDPGIQSAYYLTGDGTTLRYVRAWGTFVSPSVEAAHQYLLATLLNSHEPSVVAFCRANTTTANSVTRWKADHGGASWGSQHIPLILAGAGIRSGIVTGEPAQLEDIAPTVLTALGVGPTGMEGHVLNEALRNPSPTDWNPRAAEATQLTPLIRGLISQDKYEMAHR